MNTWPDGGMTPFRSEKNTNWEGAFRVPELIRWPGKIPAGVGLERDRPASRLAADVPRRRRRAGHRREAEGRARRSATRPSRCTSTATTCCPYLTGEADKSPRQGFIYFSDDGDVLALRFDNWKVVFMEQRVQGTMQIWAEPFVPLRVPKLFNLRTDPFERADVTSNTYYDWFIDNDYIALAATAIVDPVPRDVQGVPAAAGGAELHDRPGRQRSWRLRSRPAAEIVSDPLASWNDGPAKSAVLDFVERVDACGVPPEERVAVFDNDGTLWCEKPLPIQADFILRRLHAMAEADPKLREKQPWKAAYDRDYAWLGQVMVEHYTGDDTNVRTLLGGVIAAHAGISVDEFEEQADSFLHSAQHPTLGRNYLECAYAPMVELLRLLEANGLRELHRVGRRPRLHAADQRGAVRDPARPGDRELDRARLPRRHDHAQAGGRRSRRRPGEAGPDLEPCRPQADSRRGELERRHPDARLHAARGQADAAPARPPRRRRARVRVYGGRGEVAWSACVRRAGPWSAWRTTGRGSSSTRRAAAGRP